MTRQTGHLPRTQNRRDPRIPQTTKILYCIIYYAVTLAAYLHCNRLSTHGLRPLKSDLPWATNVLRPARPIIPLGEWVGKGGDLTKQVSKYLKIR